MTKMKTFAGAKADRADKANAWTVEDLLRELLAQIEAGDLKATRAIVLWAKDDADGKEEDHGWWAAGVSSTSEAVWMCEVHKLERMLNRSA